VTRRRYLVAAALVIAAAVAAAVVVALVPGRSAHVSPPRAGIGARAWIVPQSVLFGDTVVGTIDVLVDRRFVDPRSVQPQAAFSGFIPLRRPTRQVVETGPVTRIRYRYEFSCLTLACLPPDPIRQGRQLVRISPVRFSYRRVGGGSGAIGVGWPLMEHASRLTPVDQARLTPIDQPPFHATLAPQTATYRISPTLLVWLLCAVGGLLIAVAGMLALRFGPRRAVVAIEPPRPAVPLRQLTALERALLLLERARERGGIADQRKALENLAGVLRREGERELAGSATALAWAEPPPPTEATGALAAAVQRRIDDSGNGHHGES
jgi:hypothetical protein